jgi:hypothetical protein
MKIIVPKIEYVQAGITIAMRKKHSPALTVLAELIRLNETGEIPKAASLHKHFSKQFNIKQSKFNKIVADLINDKIIARKQNTITFCPELTKPTNKILIQQA